MSSDIEYLDLCVDKLSVGHYSSARSCSPYTAIDQCLFIHVKEVRTHRCTREDAIRKFLIDIRYDVVKCKTKCYSQLN
jgi:hypothetical protein